MAKRSDFIRNPRDWYITPAEAVRPLLPHLMERTQFAEPCAGDGQLIQHLEQHGHRCRWRSDIEPQADGIHKADALTLSTVLKQSQCVITNTPWRRDILHPMLEHFRRYTPCWLLLDADYCHTKQAKPYLKYCSKIVSVGRVKWIPDSKMTGKDNACWMRFEMEEVPYTMFYGR